MKTRLITVAFALLISAGIFAQSANQQKTPAKAPVKTTTQAQAKTPAQVPATQSKPDTSSKAKVNATQAKTNKPSQVATPAKVTPKTNTKATKPVKK